MFQTDVDYEMLFSEVKPKHDRDDEDDDDHSMDSERSMAGESILGEQQAQDGDGDDEHDSASEVSEKDCLSFLKPLIQQSSQTGAVANKSADDAAQQASVIHDRPRRQQQQQPQQQPLDDQDKTFPLPTVITASDDMNHRSNHEEPQLHQEEETGAMATSEERALVTPPDGNLVSHERSLSPFFVFPSDQGVLSGAASTVGTTVPATVSPASSQLQDVLGMLVPPNNFVALPQQPQPESSCASAAAATTTTTTTTATTFGLQQPTSQQGPGPSPGRASSTGQNMTLNEHINNCFIRQQKLLFSQHVPQFGRGGDGGAGGLLMNLNQPQARAMSHANLSIQQLLNACRSPPLSNGTVYVGKRKGMGPRTAVKGPKLHPKKNQLATKPTQNVAGIVSEPLLKKPRTAKDMPAPTGAVEASKDGKESSSTTTSSPISTTKPESLRTGSKDSTNKPLQPLISSSKKTPAQFAASGTVVTATKGARSQESKEPIVLQDYDIICGRDKLSQTHPGNKRFRELVEAHRGRYKDCMYRNDKTCITDEILALAQSWRPGGRFLKRDAGASGKDWRDVGDHYARQKVSHALRAQTKDPAGGEAFFGMQPQQRRGVMLSHMQLPSFPTQHPRQHANMQRDLENIQNQRRAESGFRDLLTTQQRLLQRNFLEGTPTHAMTNQQVMLQWGNNGLDSIPHNRLQF